MEFAASLDNCVAAGDFNARSVILGDVRDNKNGRLLNQYLAEMPLVHLDNNEPTYFGPRGASVVDHILITEDLVDYFRAPAHLGTTVTSDHIPLVAEAVLPGVRPEPITRIVSAFGRADWESFGGQIENAVHNIRTEPAEEETLDRAVAEFTEIIQRSVSVCIPRIVLTIRPERPPLPGDIVALIREKRRLYRRFLKTRDPSLKTEWNRMNALIRLRIRSFREGEWRNACAGLDWRNGAAFWRKFNLLVGKKARDPVRITENGLPIYDNVKKANIFANLLEQIHTTNEGPSFSESHRQYIEHKVLQFRQSSRDAEPAPEFFTPSEVAALLGAPKRSAPGPDTITWLILSHLPPTAIEKLTDIYNLSLQLSIFPSSWKKACVILIPKPGKDASNPSNYRPISLLDTLGKCFEKLLLRRMLIFGDDNGVVPEYQSGFRAGHSTTDLVLRLHSSVAGSFNKNHCTLAAMLDVERAFDTVWHAALIFKLISYGFPVYLVRIICSYLAGRCARVKVCSALSREYSLDAGLPQGAVLSPFLFVVFTADTPCCSNAQLGLYADDTVYWVSAFRAETAAKNLQRALDAFLVWTRKWRLKVNPLKTQTILFRHPTMPTSRRFRDHDAAIQLGDTWIDPAPTADYLGVRFDRHLTWKPELTRSLNQLRSRSALLLRLRKGIRGCSTSTLLFTFRTFVRPVIEFRWPGFISSSSVLQRLAGAERRLLRRILGAPLDHPIAQTYAESDLQDSTIIHRLARRGTRYIERIAVNRPAFLAALESIPSDTSGRRCPRKVRDNPQPLPIGTLRALQQSIDAGGTPWMPHRLHDPG